MIFTKTLVLLHKPNSLRYLLFLVFLFPLRAISQIIQVGGNEVDPDKMEINKNIFRATMGLATDTKFSVQGNYERKIIEPFTFVLKAGPAFNKQHTMTDAFGTDQYKWTMNAVVSGEVRYYFNLLRRIKHQKR